MELGTKQTRVKYPRQEGYVTDNDRYSKSDGNNNNNSNNDTHNTDNKYDNESAQ